MFIQVGVSRSDLLGGSDRFLRILPTGFGYPRQGLWWKARKENMVTKSVVCFSVTHESLWHEAKALVSHRQKVSFTANKTIKEQVRWGM